MINKIGFSMRHFGHALFVLSCALSWVSASAAPPMNIAEQLSSVQLDDGRELQFNLRQHPVSEDAFGYVGHTADRSARLYAFVHHGRVQHADIYAGGHRYKLLEHAGSEGWSEDLRIGVERPWPAEIDTAVPKTGVAIANAPRTEPAEDGVFTVDLLLLYTPRVLDHFGKEALHLEAERLVFMANAFFENSLVPVRYEITSLQRYGGTGEDRDYFQNQEDMLNDQVLSRIRDKEGADLVVLLRSNDIHTGFCGLGSLFNGGEQDFPPENVGPDRDFLNVIGVAPSVDGVTCGDIEQLFAHEIGHSMSGGHQFIPGSVRVRDDNQIWLGSYWRPYAHAGYCGGSATGSPSETVMMGGVKVNGVAAQGAYRGDLFSNSQLTVAGEACGASPTGTIEGEVDNARSITEAAPYVAAYRSRTRVQVDGRANRPASSGGSSDVPVLLVLMLMHFVLRRKPKN